MVYWPIVSWSGNYAHALKGPDCAVGHGDAPGTIMHQSDMSTE